LTIDSHQEEFADRLFHSGTTDSRNGTHVLLTPFCKIGYFEVAAKAFLRSNVEGPRLEM
jgi:hypothetical protein